MGKDVFLGDVTDKCFDLFLRAQGGSEVALEELAGVAQGGFGPANVLLNAVDSPILDEKLEYLQQKPVVATPDIQWPVDKQPALGVIPLHNNQ